MSTHATVTTPKILIQDYSAAWALTFQQLKSVYELQLDNLIVDVQHVGSTSVRGLAAKPVIDIDLVIDDRKKLTPVIEELALLGYRHQGNLGIADREAFTAMSDTAPYDGSLRSWYKHNLYVCPVDSISLKNHLALRDYLRSHPERAMEYGNLKKKLALENPYDIDLYVERKTPFIIAVLKNAGFNELALNDITEQNKASNQSNA